MSVSSGSQWGPPPLPEFLTAQLGEHGFSPDDAGRCVRLINEQSGTAAAASLFVDLGACKFLEGDIDGALAAWRHSMSTQHDAAAARALLNLGLLYERLGLHQRALVVFSNVAMRNVEPYVVDASMAAARCQVAVGDRDQAMETLARLAQHVMAREPDAPRLIEVLFALGVVAEDAGRRDRAERAWRVAAAGSASDLQQAATDRLTKLLLDQGHDDAVIDLLDRLGVGPTATDPHVQLATAEVLVRSGSHEQAAALLISLDGPTLATADRFRLADLRRRCGLVNEAIDELEPLLGERDPAVSLRASFVLGALYRTHAMTDAARSMFARAVAGDDPYWSPKAALALGDLLHEAGDDDGATAAWRRAEASPLPLTSQQARERLAGPQGDTSPTGPASIADTDGVAAPATPSAVAATDDDRSLSTSDGTMAPSNSERRTTDRSMVVASAPEPVVVALDELESPDATVIDLTVEVREPVDDEVPPVELDPVVVALDDFEPDELGPVVVTLGDLESDDADWFEPVMLDPGVGGDGADIGGAASTIIEQASDDDRTVAGVATNRPSAFADHVGAINEADHSSNPYAALAPEGAEGEAFATMRNPYAELAPNVADTDYEPPADVEPGDWESMLDDWPRDEPANKDQKKSKKKRSSAFSRYT